MKWYGICFMAIVFLLVGMSLRIMNAPNPAAVSPADAYVVNGLNGTVIYNCVPGTVVYLNEAGNDVVLEPMGSVSMGMTTPEAAKAAVEDRNLLRG